MAIADEVEASYQVVNLSVTIGGVSVDALEARVRHGIDQSNGQATVVLDSEPANLEGAIVVINAGYNGVTEQIFYGSASGVTWDWWPRGVAIDCRDRMERLRYEWGGTERTYTSTTEGSVIQNLVEAMGIDSSVTSIVDTGMTVGVVEAVRFQRGANFLNWIREIDNLCGAATFTRSDGAIYRRVVDTDTTDYTYTQGTNILSIKRNRALDGIYNGVQVDGLTYEGLTVTAFVGTANSDIPSPPGTVALKVQSNYVETNARATICATTLLDRHNYRPESYTLSVVGNPLIEVGHTLSVTAGSVGISSGTALYVTAREHAISADQGFLTTITAARVRV
jgi:hypothetical protein